MFYLGFSFLGEYFDVPAILTGELSGSEVNSVYRAYNLICSSNEKWFLGASYNRSLKNDLENEIQCGRESCYQKSLKEIKICKQGRLFIWSS